MQAITLLIQSISMVVNPLTLIAFIIVSLLVALLLVSGKRNFEIAMKKLFKSKKVIESFPDLFNWVVRATLVFFAMLFVLLAYQMTLNKPISGVPCSGDTCNGRAPQQIGCADNHAKTIGYTAGSFSANGGPRPVSVELRYSPLCKATWVKATSFVGSRIYFQDTLGRKMVEYKIPENPNNYPSFHTDMVSGKIEGKGCLEFDENNMLCTSSIKP